MNNQEIQRAYDSNLDKIKKYIEEETKKKAEAIKKDQDKDAEFERAQIIEPEKSKITKKYEKELEKYRTDMKIEQSKAKNKLRLEKLKVKIDSVNALFEESKKIISENIKGDSNKYKQLLKDLIVQGLLKLLDEKINIVCKKEDYELVNSLIDTAKNEFFEILNKEAKKGISINPKIIVDDSHFLPEET